jgi:hypothetical protein
MSILEEDQFFALFGVPCFVQGQSERESNPPSALSLIDWLVYGQKTNYVHVIPV